MSRLSKEQVEQYLTIIGENSYPAEAAELRWHIEALQSELALNQAAIVREAAKKLQKQAEEYGCEHGQVDPTTGVWEATELEMQYCETLETAAQDILAIPTDQPALDRHDAEFKSEYLKLAQSWRSLAGSPKDWVTEGSETDTAIRTAGRATMIKCAEELEGL